MTPEPLPYHPLANLFPLIDGKDFEEFCTGIKADGRLHDKIVLLDGQILDGRNRQRACDAVGLTAHYRTFDPTVEGDPLKFVIARNLHRRHLSESQRAMLAAKLANMEQGARTDIEPSANLQKVSQAAAAKLTNVSPRSVASAAKVREQGTPELVAAVEQGIVPVSVADKAAALTPQEQREVVTKAKSGDVSGAKGDIKKASRSNRETTLGKRQAALPDKRYGVILADPEWRFEPWSRATGMDRAADNHYPTSVTEVIAARPVEKIAARDCILFLWATAPMLPHALAVMAAWGFDYRTHIIWRKAERYDAKPVLGTGYWFRNGHELLLVGVRGDVPAPAPGTQWASLFDSRPRKHSQKPDEAYELIEAYFPNLPKIELNARDRRDGWDAWGNEVQEDTRGGSGTARKAPGTVVPETATAVEVRSDQQGAEPAPQFTIEQILEHELEAAGPALAPVDTATSPDIAGEDDRRKVVMAGDFQTESAEIAAANGGGDHVVSTPTAAIRADAGNAPTSADLDIPTFLRRGHPDCFVKAPG